MLGLPHGLFKFIGEAILASPGEREHIFLAAVR